MRGCFACLTLKATTLFLFCTQASPAHKGGDKIDSFISWVGGKKALRDEILLRFPIEYKKYVEVFGGAGWVLFHKPKGKDLEVFNDYDELLINLYRCVRDSPDELKKEMEYILNSRTDFQYMKELLRGKAPMPNPKRAAYFYALIRFSYGSGADHFGCKPHSMWNAFPIIDAACNRLQRVIIENKPYDKLILQYDRPYTFFYCDPPYLDAEYQYVSNKFESKDHKILADILCSIKGKFLLSYNDCDEIRKLYNRPGILVERVTRLSNLELIYEKGKKYPELIISNYDTREFLNSCVQMSLFKDFTNRIIGEREIIYDRLNEIHSCTTGDI